MKNITDNQEKMELVSKLVKDGAIDFTDAIKLLEVEVEKEFVYIPTSSNCHTYSHLIHCSRLLLGISSRFMWETQ